MIFKPSELLNIADHLNRGRVGIFPCDTILGLIAVPSRGALEKLCTIKQRKNPQFICCFPNQDCVKQWAAVNDAQNSYLEKYWPGPVTFILPLKQTSLTTWLPNQETIACRIPDYIPFNCLLNKLNQPVFSTSVNLHDMPAINHASDIPNEIKEAVDFIFDAVPPFSNDASTIVDLTTSPFKICRQGSRLVEL